jgi:conjugative relaxase-like TrwC/TraI family protein
MLSIGVLRSDSADYYLALVAEGVDEYYSVRREVPGRWIGTGAIGLDLSGEVAGEDLRALLAGNDPRSGERLGSAPRTVPGFDLTFSAPKSASLLFAFGDATVTVHVTRAHEEAVRAAFGYLEREACRVRRGHAGVDQVRAEGFAGAAFRHRSSRAGDPQLHTHVLVANVVRGIDGRWSAPDSRRLHHHARTAGYLYQAHLRHELTIRLGLAWRPVVKGSAELDGIPNLVLRAFSRRRADINAELTRRGASSRKAAQIAALATRQPKDYDEDVVSLREEWVTRAQDLGLHAEDLPSLLWRQRGLEPLAIDDFDVTDALTADSSTFDRRDVLRAIASRAGSGATVADIEARTDALLTGRHVVALTEDRYTTPAMLALEAAIIQNALGRRYDRTGIASADVIDDVLHARLTLSNEQAGMVRHVLTSGWGVDVVCGVAGAGKTRALEAARAAWEATGHRVIGAGLAARAAAELVAGSGIASGTLDALLLDLDQQPHGLPPRTVVVLDEAAMVGTRKLGRLLAHTDAPRAKVVLVGDDKQLPEIEAGGAFAGLARRLPAVTLTENLRQHDRAEREALARLRAGEVTEALDRLAVRGRITFAEDRPALLDRMIGDWERARSTGQDVLMLALRRADVEALNRAARSALRERGELASGTLDTPGRDFAVGDRVVTLANRRHVRVVNGARGTVTSIDREAGQLSVRFDTGTETALPATYLRAGHLGHAYALTIHKAQGMSCDTALLLADDELFQEAGYTALSRGRHQNQLYRVPSEHPHREIAHARIFERDDPLAGLASTLRTSRHKSLALDSLRRLPPTPAPRTRNRPVRRAGDGGSSLRSSAL